jgi:tRNA-2-methylthio-N6-dimethylallyladenosine synthase
VPADVIAERFDRLRVVVERSALAKHQGRIGRVEEVLVEGPSKKDASITAGRTRQNKLIHFLSDRPLRPGTFVEVRVIGAAPHHLRGEFVDITALPRHKTRIPVAAS